jgi:hypothetical protein
MQILDHDRTLLRTLANPSHRRTGHGYATPDQPGLHPWTSCCVIKASGVA